MSLLKLELNVEEKYKFTTNELQKQIQSDKKIMLLEWFFRSDGETSK